MIREPDIVYIGLKRSGSTFLRGYFETHPDIAWRRESGFLMDDAAFQNHRDRLPATASNGPVCIEANELLATGLMTEPGNAFENNRFVPGASMAASGCRADPVEMAGRIRQAYPDARILLVLRNQTDWLRTHYRVFMGELPPGRHKFSDFLTTLEGQLVRGGGFYDRTIGAYFDLFGRDNVRIALFEDIRDDEAAALKDLCAFLGVREAGYDPADRRYNRGPSNAEVRLRDWLASVGVGSKQLAALRPLGRVVRAVLPQSRSHADPLTDADRRMIAELYGDSNCKTAQLIGRDLARIGYPC